MPLRLPKMYGFIFGFQRRVWCPKWTPASSSSFIVTSTKEFSLLGLLALAELETGAGALLAVLLAFLLARIARQEPGRLEAVAQLAVELEQSARDAVPDRAGLARAAAARHRDTDVEPLHRLRQLQRLLDDHLQHFVGEVAVERTAVDLEVPRARAQVHARRGRLAAARAVVLGLAHVPISP